MTSQPVQILDNHKLRRTACRSAVLTVFIEHEGTGLSKNFIEEHIEGDFDRATIYRTLNTYLEKGILHKILDENNVIRFALCSSTCSNGHHQHEHIHFKCTSCETTYCLDDVSMVDLKLPAGYRKAEANYLVVGTCATCNS